MMNVIQNKKSGEDEWIEKESVEVRRVKRKKKKK